MTTPVTIEAAINGVTSKQRNPHVPREPAEIAEDALRCLAAGAAIVHNHIDLLNSGREAAERYLEAWRVVLRERPDAIVYPTVGFGGGLDERFSHVPFLAESGLVRMSVFDPGSVNLGGIGEDGLPGGSFDFVYQNTFADIRHAARLCEEHSLGPSISIFEPGFLRTTLAYERAGKLPAGAFVKFYFGGDHDYLTGGSGVGFGLPPTPVSLDAYLHMLGGSKLPWAVAVIGGDVVRSGMAKLAVERGGHIRVGLEDYAGERTPSNEELVRQAVEVAGRAGRAVATCEQASRILCLPR
jgi:uncharacterized protein (DUF849 family)